MKNFLSTLIVLLACSYSIAQYNANNATKIIEIEQQIKAVQLKVTELKGTYNYIIIDNKPVILFQLGPYRKHPPCHQRLRPNDIYKLAVNNF